MISFREKVCKQEGKRLWLVGVDAMSRVGYHNVVGSGEIPLPCSVKITFLKIVGLLAFNKKYRGVGWLCCNLFFPFHDFWQIVP